MGERIHGHETTVAPTPPPQAIAIQLRIFIQGLIESSELVFEFSLAEIVHQHGGKLSAACTHAAIIHLQYGNAIAQENLIEEQCLAAPFVAHHLTMRAAIGI